MSGINILTKSKPFIALNYDIVRFVQNITMLKKNIFSILIAGIILYLSLASASTFENVPVLPNIPNFDKFVHFAMYFGLMSAIIFENRVYLKNVKRLLLLSIIPLAYGILIEFMQGAITTDRTANFYDALANSAGIYFAAVIGFILLRRFRSDTY